MKVGDLRKALEGLPDDLPVVLAGDGEGNSYSPLSSSDTALYEADSTWSGEWYPSAEQRAAEPNNWDDPPEGAVPALFLWPVS